MVEDGTIVLHMQLQVVPQDLGVVEQVEILVVMVALLDQQIPEEVAEEDLEELLIIFVLHLQEQLVVKEL